MVELSLKLNSIKDNNQVIRYIIVGSICAIFDLLCFFALVNFLHVWYLYASALSFSLITFFGFFIQKYYTFKNNSNNHSVQLVSFFSIAVLGLLLNLFFMYFFVGILGFWYLIAIFLTKGIVLFWNFFSNKYITFSKKCELST